jgi:putative polyketide hydroxylase
MTTTPVLIVGAGPAGLVAAITLARQGIASLLVERRPSTSPFPRATGISTRSMELFRSWGLEEEVRAGEIVGDAAHRMTPRGGTGMNTAIHAAHSLGWKLGWVLRGWAPASLLDSYETERRPIGIRNTNNSAQANRPDPDAFANDLGGRLTHVWQPQLGRRVSTLDLLGDRLTLLTGPDFVAPGGAAPRVGGGPPVDVHVVDRVAADAFGISAAGAILVRPDGQVTSRWHTTSRENRTAAAAAPIPGSPAWTPLSA